MKNWIKFFYFDINGIMAHCDLYRHNPTTFFVRERADNPGMSVVKAIVQIYYAIEDNYEINAENIKLYEYSGIGYSKPIFTKSGIYTVCDNWIFVPDIDAELAA